MKQLESFNPATGERLGSVPATAPEQVSAVVSLAHDAAQAWRALSLDARTTQLRDAFKAVGPHADSMARLLSQEMGKDLRRATGEVRGALFMGDFIGRQARNAFSPEKLGSDCWQEYRPLGVVAVISPWNYPLAMASNLIVPALLAGNAVVFKPSEETPLVAQRFIELLQPHLPDNLIQIVHGRRELGQALVESEVNMVAFTGSMAAGKDIMARASSGLKRLVMELGGNDPMLVLDDANLDAAARFAVASSLENTGQMCTSTERIYVAEAVADQFEQKVVALASSYDAGPWNQMGVDMGPMINERQHQKVIMQLQDAAGKGARVLLGDVDQQPPFIQPVVIADMTPQMQLETEETFGPVIAMARFDDLDAVIERANNSDYALGAVVFGGEQANAVADRLEAGMVGVNQGVGGVGDAPWVGAKQSGFGFHGSIAGHRQFAQVRVVNR